MSSGKIERNFLDIFEKNLISDELVIFIENSPEIYNFSELKLHKESKKLDNNSKIEQIRENLKEYHFLRIKIIHSILKNTRDLTQNQKFDYCNSQRFYMKQYLKRISKNI